MRLVAHRGGARCDRIHAAGHRTQRGDQRLGRPLGRILREHVRDLRGRRELRERLRVAVVEQLGEIGLAAFGHGDQQRTRDARELALIAQPLVQRVRLAVVRDRRAAIELRGLEHGFDRGIRIAMDDAERIAGFVQIAEARERKLHVPHFAQRQAADDALVREHFGRGGIRAGQFDDGGRRRGRGHGRDDAARGLELLGDLAHARERIVRPGLRELLEIHVAVDARQQALRAELGEPLVDDAAGFAELRIARIAERQHRVLQLGELRRALGAEEFVQAARFVRRIAVAVRADDHVQQLFLRDLARLVVAGLDHARLHAQRLHRGQQLLGDLAAVVGVRGGDDGERRRRNRGGGRCGRMRRVRGHGGELRLRRTLRVCQQDLLERGNAARRRRGGAGEISGEPQQLFAVQLGGELREQLPAIVRNRKVTLKDDGAAH